MVEDLHSGLVVAHQPLRGSIRGAVVVFPLHFNQQPLQDENVFHRGGKSAKNHSAGGAGNGDLGEPAGHSGVNDHALLTLLSVQHACHGTSSGASWCKS
ncbi:hypothetical protein SUGI_0030170 [Cryptomeria japonica]|nr:hypothetical protein SUGI_0030170 [Cryptomeria japonica]